jgi:hypothetical protein
MSFMDTAQLLGNLGEFIGAIVIVATLIYLTLQVRQNTNALHAQTRQSLLSAGQTELFAMIENPDILLVMLKKEPLTAQEHIRLGFWLAGSMRSREFAWLQYQKGVIDEVQWHTEALAIQNLLLAPAGRGWWESIGRKIFSAEFARFVDDLVRDQPTTNELAEFWTSWTNRQTTAAAI